MVSSRGVNERYEPRAGGLGVGALVMQDVPGMEIPQ
jgi:hypothetical protein